MKPGSKFYPGVEPIWLWTTGSRVQATLLLCTVKKQLLCGLSLLTECTALLISDPIWKVDIGMWINYSRMDN